MVDDPNAPDAPNSWGKTPEDIDTPPRQETKWELNRHPINKQVYVLE
jgi:hypothetical protein